MPWCRGVAGIDSQTYRGDDDDEDVGCEQVRYPKCKAQDHAKYASPADSPLALRPVVHPAHISQCSGI